MSSTANESASEGPILAPDEIAALMAGIGPEEEAKALFATLPPMSQPKKVKKLSLQQMAANSPVQSPAFIRLHELLAEALHEKWLSLLTDNAGVELKKMVSETYQAILKAKGIKVYFIFECKDRGCVMVAIDIPAVVAVVDFMLGGSGKSISNEIETLSRVENRLCKRIGQSLGDILTETWQTDCDVCFDLRLIETRQDFLEVASDRDPFASVRYQIKLAESLEGGMAIHYPVTLLDPLLKTIRSSQEDDSQTMDNEWMAKLRQATDRLPLNLRFELGSYQLTVREFLNISTGDILPLGVDEKEAVKLWVESVPMFLAMPGHRDGALAAEIIAPILELNHE